MTFGATGKVTPTVQEVPAPSQDATSRYALTNTNCAIMSFLVAGNETIRQRSDGHLATETTVLMAGVVLLAGTAMEGYIQLFIFPQLRLPDGLYMPILVV